MPNTAPLVQVATVCEAALVEQDNVLSAIRMVDTFWLSPPQGAPADVVPSVGLTLLIALKSGDVIGDREIRIVLRRPDGQTTDVWRGMRTFRGGEHGTNLRIQTAVATRELGLFWFDVMDGESLLTSIPFKLILGPPPTHQPTAEK
jgi:hypothetical protein